MVEAVALINQKIARLHDKARTSHQITTKNYGFIPQVMLVTWLDFGESLSETFWRISDVVFFFKSSILLAISQDLNLTFDLTHDLDLGFRNVKFRNSDISGSVGLIDMKWTGAN